MSFVIEIPTIIFFQIKTPKVMNFSHRIMNIV